MATRQQREQELISRGFYKGIKNIYKDTPHNIPDKYIMLIADYVECLSEVEDSLGIDAKDLAAILPDVLNRVEEKNIPVHGITEGTSITMNPNMSYEATKLYFFHELTHALQTRKTQQGEECSLANNRNGSFLMEGLTQYTAERLYHVSNGTNITYREQANRVRGQSNHTCYSPLSEYQLNGNILCMLGQATDTGLNEMIGLGYQKGGRDKIKKKYESIPGNEGKFEEFMDDLEKIYAIDKFMAVGQAHVVNGNPQLLRLSNGQTFMGNLQIQEQLINKVERELAASYIENHDDAYILENYQKFERMLTTPQLKQQFSSVIDQIEQDAIQQINANRQNSNVRR